MCANYESTRRFGHFGVQRPMVDWPSEVYPAYNAPMVRRAAHAPQPLARELSLAQFGLIPHWAKDDSIGRRTYNARSETAAVKPSFREAWKWQRRCIIPLDAFYEPSWSTGKAIRWRIAAADSEPMGIAGLWSQWKDPAVPGASDVLSMTMLTVNANEHEVMRHFHKPDDEKRMIVILAPEQYDAWLDAPVTEMASFMQQWPADRLVAERAPKPMKITDAPKSPWLLPKPKPVSPQQSLFDTDA